MPDVTVVNRFEEPDGIYLFEDEEDAKAFCAAVGGPYSRTKEPVFGRYDDATAELIRNAGGTPRCPHMGLAPGFPRCVREAGHSGGCQREAQRPDIDQSNAVGLT
jgi:hypothetical protein